MKFMIVWRYGSYIIEAADWDEAVYRAVHECGSSLISLTVLTEED